ncbi:transposase [Jiangella alkaliphila]|uniref:transposase n=1 Tax=Jiangella alkaliphila TaxID=419479 RepID=UPI0038B246BD
MTRTCARSPLSTRNVVERGFNQLKQWRALASRYDKLAITYRGGVVLAAITIWLRQ